MDKSMDKSPDAFKTISEVAEDLNLPQHVLRFWETRFPQIKPLKRGGNRRYYRPQDVNFLRGIKELLYGKGYTIKGVQQLIKQDGLRSIQDFGAQGFANHAIGFERYDENLEDEDASNFDDAISDDASQTLSKADTDKSMMPHSKAHAKALAHVLDELLECERLINSLFEPQMDHV